HSRTGALLDTSFTRSFLVHPPCLSPFCPGVYRRPLPTRPLALGDGLRLERGVCMRQPYRWNVSNRNETGVLGLCAGSRPTGETLYPHIPSRGVDGYIPVVPRHPYGRRYAAQPITLSFMGGSFDFRRRRIEFFGDLG